MKFNYNLFVFILGIVSGFAPQMAWAEKCPAGCFCLKGGEYDKSDDKYDMVEKGCKSIASRDLKALLQSDPASWDDSVELCNAYLFMADNMGNSGFRTYHVGDFVEIYDSVKNLGHTSLGYYGFAAFGVYGFTKDGNFTTIDGKSCSGMEVYRCPESYPYSDTGAKVLADCYKYDENGKKKHYERTSANTSSGSGNVAANYDIANMRVLVKNLQSALGQANRVAQDLESALNTVNQGNTQSTNTSQSGSNNTPASTTTNTTPPATTPSSGTVSSSGKGGGTTSTIAKLSDLNPTIAGSRNTQKEAAKTWSVTFPYGDVSGIASCNDTNGTYAMAYPQYNFDNNYASSTGKYCWCKMTIPNGPSSWVGAGNTSSSSSCAASCASRCGSYTRGNSSFRTSIFSMATGSTGSSSSSSVTDPNADIKAKLQNGALSKWFGLLGGKSAVPQVGRAAVYDGVPSRGASISIAGKAANQRSATGTNDAQRSSTSDKAVRENPRGTNKSNRN